VNISELPNRVLLATDGSEDAAVATLAAIDIANKGGSELHVVHVWHDVPSPYAHFFIKRELERQGREVLDEQVSRIEGVGVEVAGVHLREGRISDEVISLSEELGVGLLVVGGRGQGRIERILMGSHSEDIVHCAHLPVLVLRTEPSGHRLASSSATTTPRTPKKPQAWRGAWEDSSGYARRCWYTPIHPSWRKSPRGD
jgi:nucleotide-binding universal stress UspA family protein